MASVQNMVKLNVAKSNFHNACNRFLDFHSAHAKEVWNWRITGECDEEMMNKYSRLSGEVDKTKKELEDIERMISSKRPYMKAVA